MDAVVVDRDAVLVAEDVGDRLGSLLVKLLEFEYPADEVSRVLGVGFPSWRLDRRKLASFAVLLGKSLFGSLAEYVDGDAIDEAMDRRTGQVQ